jgi:transposase
LELVGSEQDLLEYRVANADPDAVASRRARIVLLSAAGFSNREVARRLGVSEHTVCKWRTRFLRSRLRGLRQAPRRGGRRRITEQQLDSVVAASLASVPEGAALPSMRRIAEAHGLSHNSVHRIWRSFGIKPHRESSFDLSAHAPPTDKAWDVIGLYLTPPVYVLIVCMNEQSHIEAVDEGPSRRTPKAGGSAEESLVCEAGAPGPMSKMVDSVAGQVRGWSNAPEAIAKYCEFLDRIDNAAPDQMNVHLVVDNYVNHKPRQVRDWMFKRPRFQLHLTPTHDLWLDQVDRWFEREMRRDVEPSEHSSEASFIATAESYSETMRGWETPYRRMPFLWIKPADDIKATINHFSAVRGNR